MNAQNDRGYSGREGLGWASPPEAAARGASGSSHHAKPLNVLLLEDDAHDAELIQWTLAKRGVAFTMRLVDTKKGFVEALEATLPDAVLLDYGVPGYDGKRAFADLQRLCPGTPAIVVTGALGDEAAVDLLKLGIRDYVLKSNLARLGPAIEQAIAAAANVRAREAAERALHESEARMTDAIECISQPFVIYDREDRLIYCNDAFRRTFPHPGMADIRGMKFEDLIADSIARGTFKDVADFKTKWTATRTEMHRTASSTMDVVLADGRHFLATDRRMKSGGRAGLRVDVTELVRTKESLQIALAEAEGASRAKSAFLANMSHELRTPLNAVIGFSEMINDQIMGPIGTPAYAEYANHIWKAGEHLHGLLGNILDLATIEANAVDVRDGQ
ncbi:MAG: response regulator, partial [Alphaproteobacteria bacterium]|nr:response regulator [Alphaproteobacteria bacterium]